MSDAPTRTRLLELVQQIRKYERMHWQLACMVYSTPEDNKRAAKQLKECRATTDRIYSTLCVSISRLPEAPNV